MRRIAMILICLFLQSNLLIRSQAVESFFKILTIEDGFSSESINSVYIDHAGFAWFSTSNGLNRFDGYSVELFKTIKSDENSLSSNAVIVVIEDDKGYLWIGTGEGLNRLDERTNVFQRYFHNPEDTTSISNNKIEKLFIDKDKNLWIGTENGMNLYNPITNSFLRYPVSPNSAASMQNNNINSIIEDLDGNLWVSSWGGWLSRLNKKTGEITSFKNPDNRSFLEIGSELTITQMHLKTIVFTSCTTIIY